MPLLSMPLMALIPIITRFRARTGLDRPPRGPLPDQPFHPFRFPGPLVFWGALTLLGLVPGGHAANLDQSRASPVPLTRSDADRSAGSAGSTTPASRITHFSVTETLENGSNLKAVNEVVYVTGTIDADQDVRMRDLALSMVRRGRLPSLVVFQANDGGHLGAAMRLGRLIRELGAQTAVTGTCASACIYAYAGGVRRASTPDSHFGLHLARRAQGRGINAAEDEQVAILRYEYLDEMGIDPALVIWESDLAPNEVRWLTQDETQATGLTNQLLATDALPVPSGK